LEVHHKPKPWHGWREFLKEYAIIVIGVLTALGAGEAVQALHWRADVAEARKALVDEVGANALLSAQGVEESRCLLRRLGEYTTWAKGGPRPAVQLQGIRLNVPSSTVWNATQAAQSIGHMPLRERLAFAHFYADVVNQQAVFQSLRAAFVELARDSDRTELSPDEAHRVTGDVTALSIWLSVRGITAAGLVKAAKDLGVARPPIPDADRQRLAQLCGTSGAGR
jgi:hypothetical protein